MGKNLIKKPMIKNNIKKIKEYDFSVIPKEIFISTMTMTCKLNCDINVYNVGKYLELNKKRVVKISYDCQKSIIPQVRTLKVVKKRAKNLFEELERKKKKRTKVFYNQVTVEIKRNLSFVKLSEKNKKLKNKNQYVNIKLFRNGSLQMTGVKSIADFKYVVGVLISELSKVRAVYHKHEYVLTDGEKEEKIVEEKLKIIKFAKTKKRLLIEEQGDVVEIEDKKEKEIKYINYKLVMINTNFNLPYKVNREKVYELLRQEKVKCKYESCIHAGVNIKYQYSKDKKISIFIFESGSVIITGANKPIHIKMAYEFIMEKLTKYGDEITMTKNDTEAQEELIAKFLALEEATEKEIKKNK